MDQWIQNFQILRKKHSHEIIIAETRGKLKAFGRTFNKYLQDLIYLRLNELLLIKSVEILYFNIGSTWNNWHFYDFLAVCLKNTLSEVLREILNRPNFQLFQNALGNTKMEKIESQFS